jgi:hypothetical protein
MRRRNLLALALVALVVIGAGAAYAYFRSSGSGAGTATTSAGGQTVAVVTATATVSTRLLPGSSGDVTLNVNNPNTFAVTLATVNGGPAAISVTGGAGCTLANSGVTFNNQSGLNVAVPANSSSLVVHLPGAASMSASSASGCQGATFNIPVSITVHQP